MQNYGFKAHRFCRSLDWLCLFGTPRFKPSYTGISDEKLIDALQNGKAQKFEYACELCWKAIKHYLVSQQGIDEASPKKVAKAFYLIGMLSE
jgi:hypothetical protein